MKQTPPNPVPTIESGDGLWNGRLFRFQILNSTNRWAKDNLHLLKHGDVIQAYFQTEGKGRQSRRWMAAPEGCLTISIVLRNNGELPHEKTPMVGQAAAIAVRDMLRAYAIEARCKWPNDVMICDKKCAGILCEAVLSSKIIIIGIGLNVNVTEEALRQLSPDRPASSMLSCSGEHYSPDSVRTQLLQACGRTFLALTAGGGGWLIEEWNKADWLSGCMIEVQEADSTFRGKYAGLDSEGRLIVIDSKGVRNSYFAGDVKKVVNES